MAREQLWINGYNLMDGQFRDTEVVSFRSPAPVGENPTVAGRTGAIYRRKRHGPGGFRVNMWLGDQSAALEEVRGMWDDLLRMVNQPNNLATVTWVLSDGSTRTCYAENVGEIEPAALGVKGVRAQLEFSIPDAYWWGADGSASGTGASGTVDLVWQQPASAPLEHLVYTLTGPFTSMTVTAPSTGDSFTYAASVSGGQSVVVDAAAGTVTGSGVDPRKLSYNADRILTVVPGAPGTTPQVQWSTAGGSGATGLQVAGKVAYQ